MRVIAADAATFCSCFSFSFAPKLVLKTCFTKPTARLAEEATASSWDLSRRMSKAFFGGFDSFFVDAFDFKRSNDNVRGAGDE